MKKAMDIFVDAVDHSGKSQYEIAKEIGVLTKAKPALGGPETHHTAVRAGGKPSSSKRTLSSANGRLPMGAFSYA